MSYSPFQFRVLRFCQHSGPKRHVAQVPDRREEVGVPCIPPNMTHRIAGAAHKTVPGIPFPSHLGVLVIVQPDFPPVARPNCLPPLLKPRVVFAAASRPFREIGRFRPNRVWMNEIGMGECGLDDRNPAFTEIIFQRPNRGNQVPVVNSEVEHYRLFCILHRDGFEAMSQGLDEHLTQVCGGQFLRSLSWPTIPSPGTPATGSKESQARPGQTRLRDIYQPPNTFPQMLPASLIKT